jgi:hypothetical protein
MVRMGSLTAWTILPCPARRPILSLAAEERSAEVSDGTARADLR